ncbi:UNVERIFIED_ORG: hypothetical protein FNL38_104422 [Nocardia globerula]|uniref:Uncharacterized protein n=1 Tax=Nocardia globerula TaxID=1818 RepID=A0A652YPK4_NOCGL|nr:hypothetical protein [Rhodococcus globerulus]NMD62715.1 hypothetical protein [Nocardia globerula]PVX68169.1 hypothetical protein C8E04_5549 [Rhodococcus globerulus]
MTTRKESLSSTLDLISLIGEERFEEVHTVLTSMSDAERTGVLLSAIAFAATAFKLIEENNS